MADIQERFTEALSSLVRRAREEGGVVSETEISEAFSSFLLDEAQQQLIRDYLRENHIGIGEAIDPASYLTEEEHRYLDDYLAEIGSLPVLSLSHKKKLIRAVGQGDTAAEGRLIEGYLMMIADIARLYAEQGVFLEDLIGEGNMAMAAAVRQLREHGGGEALEDPDRYFSRGIMDAMEALVTENLAEDGRGMQAVKLVSEVAEKARKLSKDLHRSVTVEELMEETGWEREHILEAIRLCGDQIEEINTSGLDLYDRATRERAEALYDEARKRLFPGGEA